MHKLFFLKGEAHHVHKSSQTSDGHFIDFRIGAKSVHWQRHADVNSGDLIAVSGRNSRGGFRPIILHNLTTEIIYNERNWIGYAVFSALFMLVSVVMGAIGFSLSFLESGILFSGLSLLMLGVSLYIMWEAYVHRTCAQLHRKKLRSSQD